MTSAPVPTSCGRRVTESRGRPALGELANQVEVDDELVGSDLAVVHTRLRLRDGASVRNQVELAFRDGAWKVIGYHLEGAPPTTSPN